MTPEEAEQLLDRAAWLRHACDLDLLSFFARHPRAFLDSETLARRLGHDLNAIAASLDVLMNAELITRAQTPAHAARLYAFTPKDPQGEWARALLHAASTRPGRLSLKQVLSSRVRHPLARAPVVRETHHDDASHPRRPVIVASNRNAR